MRPPPRSNTGDRMAPPPYKPRGENIPPQGVPRSSTSHRPARSQEDAIRARRLAGESSISKPGPSKQELDIFADPVDSSTARRLESRRPRRNSDSSVMSKSLDPEEEKKRQERIRRERRERRDREGKDPRRKPDRKLDIIDKLDVTSIYGTGGEHSESQASSPN